jgi:hypothetical protein
MTPIKGRGSALSTWWCQTAARSDHPLRQLESRCAPRTPPASTPASGRSRCAASAARRRWGASASRSTSRCWCWGRCSCVSDSRRAARRARAPARGWPCSRSQRRAR